MAEPPVTLVTGAMGCIGAWTLFHLVKSGRRAVSFDLSEDRSRLDLLLARQEQDEAITFVRGDLTDASQVLDAIEKYRVERVIHLAALQVPACRANPALGARVNVTGTVNVFEAARQAGLKHLMYASSVAVYGPPAASSLDNLLPDDTAPKPATLYGVYKVANEGTARVYWQDYGISSVALRPYTVYGVGRDQGLTSDPTKAMLSAVAGKPFHINFNGPCQYHDASDVARLCIAAADGETEGAQGYNLGGTPVTSEQIAELILTDSPGAQITWSNTRLPFPAGLEGHELRQAFPDFTFTSIEEGVRRTLDQFRSLVQSGKLSVV